MENYKLEGEDCVEDTPALTCDAEAHKVLNEAGDACVCEDGYVEDADTHECIIEADPVEMKCVEEGGTWADGSCECNDGKVWDESTESCVVMHIFACEIGWTWDAELGQCVEM